VGVLTEYPDSTEEPATYDLDGQLATRTDGRAYTTEYSYDVTGRLEGIDYPSGTDTAFEYLENGARSEMTDRTGTTLWVYNARDEVTQVNSPQGTVNYTYLATGQRYTVGRSGGPTTTYSYDDAGRATSLTNGYSETTTFTLDAVGRCTQQTHANGTKVLSTYSSTRGWLTVLEHKQSDNDVLARYEYTRDASGHITEVEQPSDHVVEYDYDAAYQLTGEERTGSNSYSIGYTYDDAGNRLTKTQNSITENYTYGDNNQLLTAGSKTYAYDDNGNLTSVTVGMNVTSLTWDFNNKLTGITYPNSSTNTFVTNDLGHRVGLTDGGGSTSYLYDGSRVLADSRADYTNGGVTGIISERVSSTSKVYHGDQLGSTRGLSNGSEAITDSREYDSWGLTIASSGSGSPFGFVGGQGYQKDPDSGLMLLGARYYDPNVGRFISRDPIGYNGGLNLYGYCDNDPVNSADPSGNASFKHGGERYDSYIGDPDRVKGLPHWDGPNGKWIDNTGKLHDPRKGKVVNVPKGVQAEIDKELAKWGDKTGQAPLPPDEMQGKGWWWDPADKKWKQDEAIKEDFSIYIPFLPVPKFLPLPFQLPRFPWLPVPVPG